MATAMDIVRIAQNEVGVKESPANSNRVKYNTWFYGREVSGSAYPWCAAFACWVLNEVGAGGLCVRSASCPVIKSDAQRRGTYHTGSSGIRSGDLVLYQFDRDADPDHIGIVESVGSSTIVAIEGNTSTSNDSNGGAVMRRSRSKSLIMGYVRPAYDGAAQTVQRICGYSTDSFIRDVQRACGVDVDGIVGNQTRGALPELSRTCNATHAAVRHVQTRLWALGYDVGSAGADGDIGKDTDAAVKAYQSAHDLQPDGVIGPLTWAALMR